MNPLVSYAILISVGEKVIWLYLEILKALTKFNAHYDKNIQENWTWGTWEILNMIASVSVQISHSVVSDSLRPHGLQHAMPPCPSPTPRVCSNSCPLSQWCHPTISSSIVPFSCYLQSFPASGSFLMSQLFESGGQKVLEFQLQHQSFQWTLRTDTL